jgi:hypothetical protein
MIHAHFPELTEQAGDEKSPAHASDTSGAMRVTELGKCGIEQKKWMCSRGRFSARQRWKCANSWMSFTTSSRRQRAQQHLRFDDGRWTPQ